MLIHHRILFILPLLMTVSFAKDKIIPLRKSQVLFQGKYGHRRNIGKIQGLIPLVSQMDSLWFLDLRFLRDSHTNKEGNLGLGYRYKGHDSIFGIYGFFDRRRSLLDNVYNQLTLGFERLTEKSDMRLNLYLPQEKVFKTHHNHENTTITTIETPLKGIDFEVGRTVPFLDSLKIFGGGFAFKGKENISSFAGFSVRMQWKWNDHISMETSYRKDCVRKNHTYVGISLQIPIGSRTKNRKQEKKKTDLEKRMVDFPLRDEDIVAVVSRHVHVNPLIQKIEFLPKEEQDPALIEKEDVKKQTLVLLDEFQSDPIHLQKPEVFEKPEEDLRRERNLLEWGSVTFEEEIFEKPKKEILSLDQVEEVSSVGKMTVNDQNIVEISSEVIMNSEEQPTQMNQSPTDKILEVLQDAVEKQGYDSKSLLEYFQGLLNQEAVDEEDLQEQRKWILEKKELEHEIAIARQDELNQARLKSDKPQIRGVRRAKSLELETLLRSRTREDQPLQKKPKPVINVQAEREKLEKETERFLKKSEEKRIRLEEEFNQAFEKVVDEDKENIKPKETLKQREEYALIFAQKEKSELMKGLNTLKQGQIPFDEKIALKAKIEESFATLEQELSALKRPAIRRYEFLHHYQNWKDQISQKASLPCVVVEQSIEKRESFDKSLFEDLVKVMLLKGETKISVASHLKNVPLQAEDEESRKWRIERENLLEEIQKSKEIEKK